MKKYYIEVICILLQLFVLINIIQVTKSSASNELELQSTISDNKTCNASIGSCYCDEMCTMKSDCCDDYQNFIQQKELKNISSMPRHDCIHTARTFADDRDLEKHGGWFMAVAQCPSGTGIELVKRCTKSKDLFIHFDDYTVKDNSNGSKIARKFISLDLTHLTFRIRKEDIRLMAPVVSKVNGRVYANIYCAYCHNELNSVVTGDELMGSTFQERLYMYSVFVHCRTYQDTDRLCVANSQLPPSLRRPCDNRKYLKPKSTQDVFSLSDFKWHQFMVMPQNYLELKSDDDVPVEDNETLRIIESFLDIMQLLICIFSALSLCVLIIVYSTTRELRRRISNQLVMGLATSMLGLLSVYLTLPLLINQKSHSSQGNCLTIAVLLHYFFIGTFAWMSTLGLSLMNTFGGVQTCHICFIYLKQRLTRSGGNTNSLSQMKGMMTRTDMRNQSKPIHRRTLFSMLFAIALPLCFVVPALALNEFYRFNPCHINIDEDHYLYSTFLDSGKQKANCTDTLKQMEYFSPGFCSIESHKRPWFTKHGGFIVWFLTPTTLMLVFNSIVLLLVGMYIWLVNKNKTLKSLSENKPLEKDSKISNTPEKSNRNMMRICLHLSITLGTVWIFQLLASLFPQQPILSRIAGLVSSAQGAALGFVSLMNTKRGKLLFTWTSIFSTGRSAVRSSGAKSGSSSSRSNTKPTNSSDLAS
ncbi:unnamed protein product [Trichobilharzia szidati]|nr:unnamed protein product [Trichobilharzia szidati]